MGYNSTFYALDIQSKPICSGIYATLIQKLYRLDCPNSCMNKTAEEAVYMKLPSRLGGCVNIS